VDHDPPIPQVECEEIVARIERGDGLVLVDALPPMSYAHSHLPGAINLPPERVDELAARRIPDRNAEIVVYCASASCESSVETAEKLIGLGYTNVAHYVEGKKGWIAAGLPVERGSRARRSPASRG
jgi:rhodanese-related sulfurtransferase